MTDGPADARTDDERLILLLVGAVGAGKGTQASILSRELGLPHLASGNLFRAAMAAGTPLGDEAREYMERGELVPDEITIGMFMEELARPNASRGAILDGFPRTVGQARALDETLASQGERIRRVIYIEVPTEKLVRRVAGRWICPTCGTPYHEDTDPPQTAGVCDRDGTPLRQRDDDRPEVVRARLDRQVPPMLAVVDHYERAGIVDRLDGTRSIDEVTAAILSRIEREAEA
ncbi:MAG TPA: nucleoside monophosphate kinase [Candidatus Limnocylindrales bacterium]|nr:nucleoside monophosphate kinase [Candidatus Limnocylindrales bacterium]